MKEIAGQAAFSGSADTTIMVSGVAGPDADKESLDWFECRDIEMHGDSRLVLPHVAVNVLSESEEGVVGIIRSEHASSTCTKHY